MGNAAGPAEGLTRLDARRVNAPGSESSVRTVSAPVGGIAEAGVLHDARVRALVFDAGHHGGTLFRPIGQRAALCGRLSELLGRVLMLRASRREDRKRVPQYSSSLIRGGRTGIFREVWCGAGQAPGGPFAPGPRFW